jgi:MFS family permease
MNAPPGAPAATTSAGLGLVLTVTLLVQVMMAFAHMVPAVTAPRVAGDLGVAPESLGLFMLVAGVTAVVASPFLGTLIHRFGAFRLNQFGVIAVALAMLAGATGWVPMLLVCAMLLGLGMTTAMPTAAQLLARVTPPHRLSVVLSIRQAGVPIGYALTGLVVPALLLVIDWRLVLALIALALLASALLEAPLRSRIEGGPPMAARAGGGAASLPALMRSVLANRRLLAISLCSMSYSFAQSALMVYLVSYLNLELGYSLASAGAVMSLSLSVALVARLVWGWVADRVGTFIVLGGLGLASAVLSGIAACFSPAWPVWLVCTVAAGLGATMTAWNGVYAGGVVRLSPAGEAGAIMGASNVFGYVGMLLGPSLGALAISLTGTYAAAYILSVVVTLPVAWKLLALARSGNDRHGRS